MHTKGASSSPTSHAAHPKGARRSSTSEATRTEGTPPDPTSDPLRTEPEATSTSSNTPGTLPPMPGTTAKTLEEARDLSRWGPACNAVLVLAADAYGPKLALDLLGQVCEWAIPPDGKHPWPYDTGIALEDHLEPLFEKVRDHRRRDPNVTRRAGEAEWQPTGPADSPEALTIELDKRRWMAKKMREQFAADPEALAVWEWALRPTAENEAACPTGSVRDHARTRSLRYSRQLQQEFHEVAEKGERA